MSDSSTAWRALYRCDDLLQARAVATSIAAMEFDAQIRCANGNLEHSDREGHVNVDFPGPYSVEVVDQDWPELVGALDEIVGEQAEFDQRIQRRQRRSGLILAITMLLAVILWRIVRAFH